MKPQPSEILARLRAWKDSLPGVPQTAEGMSMIAGLIWNMISTREEVDWIFNIALPKMRRFSFPELRGIFCTRFEPADGVYDYATETPGFTAADMERDYFERERKENEQRFLEYRRQAKLLPPAEPVVLPELRPLPEPSAQPRKKQAAPATQSHAPRLSEADFKRAVEEAPKLSEAEKRRLEAELHAQLEALQKKTS